MDDTCVPSTSYVLQAVLISRVWCVEYELFLRQAAALPIILIEKVTKLVKMKTRFKLLVFIHQSLMLELSAQWDCLSGA